MQKLVSQNKSHGKKPDNSSIYVCDRGSVGSPYLCTSLTDTEQAVITVVGMALHQESLKCFSFSAAFQLINKYYWSINGQSLPQTPSSSQAWERSLWFSLSCNNFHYLWLHFLSNVLTFIDTANAKASRALPGFALCCSLTGEWVWACFLVSVPVWFFPKPLYRNWEHSTRLKVPITPALFWMSV